MSSLNFLLWLDTLRAPLPDRLMVAASWLGSEEAYMLLLATVYLCIAHRFGFHLFALFLFSAWLNAVLKQALGTPRPFELYPELLHPLDPASAGGPGFPSGHAQNAVAVWGLIALRQRAPWARVIPLALILLIAFSRLYCQLHWPVDVLGGLAVGCAILVGYLLLVGMWQTRGWRVSFRGASGLVIGAAAVMFLVGREAEAAIQSAGALLGAGSGFVLLQRGHRFHTRASLPAQAAKLLTALAVLLALRVGGKALFGDEPHLLLARYALIGLACAYLLPVLFTAVQSWHRRLGCGPADKG